MKTIRKFTRDALLKRPCGCAKCAAKREASRAAATPTKDERKPVDLNEIHRRFWAKQAGKE